ncbi:MAG: glycosyltransferase family 4 protein [Deltaproteobacteria bacterium]|nr:glycosyltransferase family 4 protein [Deltaproteobacteria bacterium]
MRILLLTTSYPTAPGDFRGGFVEDYARELASLGHDVHVLVPHPGGDALESESANGITIERIRSPRLLGDGSSAFGELGVLTAVAHTPAKAADVALALAALTRRALEAARSSDLVITHWLVPGGIIGAVLSHLRGIPHIAVEHGGGARVLARMPGRALALRFILSGSAAVQLVSRQIKERLAQAVPSCAERLEALSLVFPAPIASDGQVPSARHYLPPSRILFVGRLVPGKGLEILLTAMRQLRHARLTVVGDGPQRTLLADPTDGDGLRSRVTLTGFVPRPDLDVIYRAHDILVIPSLAGLFDQVQGNGASPKSDVRGAPRPLQAQVGVDVHAGNALTAGSLPRSTGEGLPRVLLEGMAAGLVPVVSRVGGMPDLVRDGENGLVFPPGDAEALARCLRSLANNPKLCARLSARARKAAARYTFPQLARLLDIRLRAVGIEHRLERPRFLRRHR